MVAAYLLPKHLWPTIVAIGLMFPAALSAAPPPQLHWQRPSERDVQLAVYARRALMSDPLLEPLNLGVSVRQNVATLWGPIPSQQHAQRAVERLRGVQGLIEIRSELYVAPADEPLKLPLEPPHDPRAPGALAGLPIEREPRSFLSLTDSVSLLPPIAHSNRPAVELPTDASPDLLLAIEQLRQSDPRYRLLKLQLQGGVIHLYGMAGSWEDVHELSQRLSQLRGVERVVPRALQIDPRFGPTK